MIGPTGSVRVMVASKPVDFRKGADGLAALVRRDAAPIRSRVRFTCSAAKRADLVKIVWWDGHGLCLFTNDLRSYCTASIFS